MSPEEVCVIIPGYNESKNISRVVGSVKGLGFPVLVVDDGSTDDMSLQARKAGAEVVSYTPNQGKGVALRRGVEWFLTGSSLPAVIFMDSDGQHDPEDLPDFLKALDDPKSDLVIGNRMSDPRGMPFIRRLTNRFMSVILSLAAGQFVPDTQCGYRAARRECLSRLQLKTTRFEIESEMILEASRTGSKVASIPVRSVYEGGTSHIHPIRDTVRFFQFLFGYLRKRRPISP